MDLIPEKDDVASELAGKERELHQLRARISELRSELAEWVG